MQKKLNFKVQGQHKMLKAGMSDINIKCNGYIIQVQSTGGHTTISKSMKGQKSFSFKRAKDSRW